MLLIFRVLHIVRYYVFPFYEESRLNESINLQDYMNIYLEYIIPNSIAFERILANLTCLRAKTSILEITINTPRTSYIPIIQKKM